MTETDVQSHPQRGGSASSSNSGPGGLLSKIVTRSPSRRHKPVGSTTSIDATLATAHPSGSTPPRSATQRARPTYGRTTTAPAASAPVTLSAIKAELVANRTNSDVTGLADSMLPLHLPVAVPLHYKKDTSKATTPVSAQEKDGLPEAPPSNVALHGVLLNGSGGASATLPTSAATLFAHIQEMASKRIATLDYLRKAHEGRSFWFNTVQFTETDISKLPSYTPVRLSRRATNFMVLGMSIPVVLDIHPQPHPQSSPAVTVAAVQEYLKSLNTLLTEFESFQQLHPPDGSTASSLSRARLPQMFKRAATTSRPRKSSGAVSDIGLPMLPQTAPSPPSIPEGQGAHHASVPSIDATANGTVLPSAAAAVTSPHAAPPASANFPTASAFPAPGPYDAPNSTLLPNEGPYTYLITPPLPFSPDFFAVFATLCDVLIDTYQRLLQILSGPSACTPIVSDLFSKVDGRIRKVMVSAIVREFEVSSRETAKREMMGVQKVVLGGLMA